MTEVMLGPGGEPVGEPAPPRARADLGQWFIVALLVAASIRIVAAAIAGFIEWSRHSEEFRFAGGKHRAGTILLDFVRFGDGSGALLTLAITGVLYWYVHAHNGPWFSGRRFALLGMGLSLLTAVAAVGGIVGYALYLSGEPNIADTMVQVGGEELGYGLVAAVSAIAMYRITWAIDDGLLADVAPAEQSDLLDSGETEIG